MPQREDLDMEVAILSKNFRYLGSLTELKIMAWQESVITGKQYVNFSLPAGTWFLPNWRIWGHV